MIITMQPTKVISKLKLIILIIIIIILIQISFIRIITKINLLKKIMQLNKNVFKINLKKKKLLTLNLILKSKIIINQQK